VKGEVDVVRLVSLGLKKHPRKLALVENLNAVAKKNPYKE
jgi:hypothetical protein